MQNLTQSLNQIDKFFLKKRRLEKMNRFRKP